MSRRKQAKPRAFLKLDEKSDKCENLSELNEAKEELVSDSAESSDELEDELTEQNCSPTEVPTNGEENIGNPAATDTLSKIHDDSGVNCQGADDDKGSTKLESFGSGTNKENECNTLLEQDASLLDENEDALLHDDDDDEYGDDDDLQSLESFYSDMYSTHTSSSYSPSISDGTLTPNSLHHQQQQQHLQLTAIQQYAQQQQQQHSEEQQTQNDNPNQQHQQQQQLSSQNVKLAAHNNKNDETAPMHEKGAGTRNSLVAAAKRHGRQKLHYHHHHHHHNHAEHLLRIPDKLCKVDRHAAKLSKLTSDGISKGTNANNNASDGSYQCQFCDKSFPRLGYLKKHEQSHAEHLPFKCEYCARLFKHKRSRDRHTKLHTGDRRYKCPHCEAAFSRSDHLKIHMKTHDNQKPFQCTVCNRGYNTAAALTSHMQNHKKQAAILAAGGNPQAYSYSPRSAGSGSSTSSSLQKRRYALTTAAVDNAANHYENAKRTRSSSLYKCTCCGRYDFETLDKLNEHMLSMHDKQQQSPLATQKPESLPHNTLELSCEYCTMKFLNIAAMFHHMRNTHMDRISSPNAYIEHFQRFTTAAAFSPRHASQVPRPELQQQDKIKEECDATQQQQNNNDQQSGGHLEAEEPTDLSQNKQRRSPATPSELLHSPPKALAESAHKPEVFLCNQCNAGLPDFESFRNHLKMHIVQGIQFVCQHCGLTLREQAEYERHVIGHYLITNIEYACTADGCAKSFSKPEELQSHLLDSHIVQMLKCNLCNELFDSKVAIQLHFSCTHSAESKLLRCSACMEIFDAEEEFNLHVKTRHQHNLNGASSNLSISNLQCIFCRAVCSSELEMHFHLAAHARQFRCPSCPETFHVEFLLDRHMQTHHGELITNSEHMPQGLPPPPPPPAAVNNKERYEEHTDGGQSNQLKSLYANTYFGKTPIMSLAHQQNNNNNLLDYNVAFAAVHLNKGMFHNDLAGKHYSPLQVDTNVMKHPGFMYGLGQRYFDTNRALIDMYAQHQEKLNAATNGNYFTSPSKQQPQQHTAHAQHGQQTGEARICTPIDVLASPVTGYSCGMCDRNDFRTEAELHSHRKIVHNMKTGVSLRCAYCSDNFKSRSELEHHMKTCHNSTGKHKCLICDEIFPSPAILAEHKLQHSKVGQSGKCSHCAKPLGDVAAYKEHLSEHNAECQLPVQCICCRQTLHSEFEIGLHARFHTKSSSMQEHVCAMCLEPMSNANKEAKICEACCRKHKLNTKYKQHADGYKVAEVRLPIVENCCNLCQMVLPSASKLQEHLVEHTFAGCEERGFNCYICSAVFTATNGLLSHMLEHGLNARPYDCNQCTEKFYFRAELEHHQVDHDKHKQNETESSALKMSTAAGPAKAKATAQSGTEDEELVSNDAEVKQEVFDKDEHAGEDDEYIEVEQVAEHTHTHNKNSPLAHDDQPQQQQQQHELDAK